MHRSMQNNTQHTGAYFLTDRVTVDNCLRIGTGTGSTVCVTLLKSAEAVFCFKRCFAGSFVLLHDVCVSPLGRHLR